ncbi:MAG: 2-polyprenylphenol 6-hydroxylase [Rickettsiaceae bacterium]|nr:2-polyprenylphenol 6-hydroxylase [Rickettsiaceae bacterium]
MKLIYSFFATLFFIRRLAKFGLFAYLSRALENRTINLISLLFAPIYTLFIHNQKKFNLAKSVEKLGPVFIKFGQTLSTRPDIIGNNTAELLRKLQDNISSFDTKLAKKIIESELGASIDSIFADFADKEIASASIAQVYKATLKNDEHVAVKVLRPDVYSLYKKDILVLKSLAYILQRIFSDLRNIKLIESVLIFEKVMNQEMDFKNEAAYCSSISDNFANDATVKIPKVYWSYTSSKVLVLEWIDGISIYDKNSLLEAQLDVKLCLQKLSVAFFNQAFRDGCFHADLHPGNILITQEGKVAFLDFGIVSFLSERDRLAIAEILYCLITKNYYRVAEIHKEIGFIPENVNLHEFAIACRIVGEPIINRAANLISVGHLLENLQKITSSFGMQTQPQLIMLQKTIIVLEGIGTILASDVNMWHLAEPWIKKWASKNLGLDAKILRYLRTLITNISCKS